jgi:hypothetical protein
MGCAVLNAIEQWSVTRVEKEFEAPSVECPCIPAKALIGNSLDDWELSAKVIAERRGTWEGGELRINYVSCHISSMCNSLGISWLS